MKKTVDWIFLGLLSVTLIGCANSNGEAQNDSIQLSKEVIVKEVEASTKPKSVVEPLPTKSYSYEDFKGAYAIFEEEPYSSKILYVLILTETNYIDIVPEWMEYSVFDIQSTEIKENNLSLDYATEEESTSGFLELELEEEGDSFFLLLNNEHLVYPITQEQLKAQNIEVSSEHFE